MEELSQQELYIRMGSGQGQPLAVFIYTPFCGTCKLTERMLEVIMTMQPKLPLVKSNILYLPQITQEWQITSVPCIVIMEPGKERRFIYRMQSVDELYRQFMPLISSES